MFNNNVGIGELMMKKGSISIMDYERHYINEQFWFIYLIERPKIFFSSDVKTLFEQTLLPNGNKFMSLNVVYILRNSWDFPIYKVYSEN